MSHFCKINDTSIVIAAAIWGRIGQESQSVYTTAVVALMNNGSSRDSSLMHLMLCLAFITAKVNFVVSASHVRGINNSLADALSRNDHEFLLSYYPRLY